MPQRGASPLRSQAASAAGSHWVRTASATQDAPLRRRSHNLRDVQCLFEGWVFARTSVEALVCARGALSVEAAGLPPIGTGCEGGFVTWLDVCA